jgi:RNA polymerase sigma-54 factor
VVQRQERFFDEGPDALKPLRQEDVADQLNLHASTVSRAVQEKYIETPHGMFPLKAFFPRGVNSGTGQQQARGSVQDRLAAIVAAEDPEHPLSDDTLVDMLARENIRLSRRTVCKYRDELGIPPASRRKGLARIMGAKTAR